MDLLKSIGLLVILLGLTILFAAFAEQRSMWHGAQGRVVNKGSSRQSQWLWLETVKGTRQVYVGNATNAVCGINDLFKRAPRSVLVTCRDETAVDWGGIAYLLIALLWLSASGFMIWSIFQQLRD